MELPFPDNSFDIYTVSFGMRNFANYQKVHMCPCVLVPVMVRVAFAAKLLIISFAEMSVKFQGIVKHQSYFHFL